MMRHACKNGEQKHGERVDSGGGGTLSLHCHHTTVVSTNRS
jgi:hypothetical protein